MWYGQVEGTDIVVLDPRFKACFPGHVRVEVAAAGVNFADTMARTGLYPDAPKTPSVVGYEVAGTVTEVASDVEGISLGARVMAGTRFGGYASQVVVPTGAVVPLPENVSFEQGAAIPVNYATAWAALQCCTTPRMSAFGWIP